MGLTSAFLEIMKLSSAHISEMYCSSNFLQNIVEEFKFLYGGRYRVRREWSPFSGPEIYLWVYFLILKYMNSPNDQTAVYE